MPETFCLIRVTDCETTGLSDPIRPVEVGWTDVRLFPTGWAIESGPHARLVVPGRRIEHAARATHHISQEEADAGMDLVEAIQKHLLPGADFWAFHNAEFDAPLLGLRKNIICTLKTAKVAWPESESFKNGALRYERGLCIDDPRAYPPHRAGPDSYITSHLLLDLLKINQPETMVEISQNPVKLLKIDFGMHEGKRFTELPSDYLNFILEKSDMPNDPKRADVVYTARLERERRRKDAVDNPSSSPWASPPPAPENDPDAWRRDIGKF